MLLYRVVTRSANAVLNGRGAARSKVNRWNSHGTEVLYTSETRELAIAEISSHVPIGLLPDPHLMVIEISAEHLIIELKSSEYPATWNNVPAEEQSKMVGDRFISESRFLAMKVKSRHGSSDKGNVLLNPNHAEFLKAVKVKAVIALKK